MNLDGYLHPAGCFCAGCIELRKRFERVVAGIQFGEPIRHFTDCLCDGCRELDAMPAHDPRKFRAAQKPMKQEASE